jgi:hypothetical protein
VNSAGQDNHYTDPITNMHFSAQGYAKLTEMLKPDIAVLEGGYSIEGALPYVNVGIILALAGLDYGKVTEPDYEPEKIRQTKEVSKKVAMACDDAVRIWRGRERLREKMAAGGKFAERQRSIYYDTDDIMETQRENIRVCPDCSGVLAIDSSAGGGNRIYAVHVPRKACDACRELGHEWYRTAGALYDWVYLQDRTCDEYFSCKGKRNKWEPPCSTPSRWA